MSTILQTFPNPDPTQSYQVKIAPPECETQCPESETETANLIITYVPNKMCLETNSVTAFWLSFKDSGLFYEEKSLKIFQEIKKTIAPKYLLVKTIHTLQDGTSTSIAVEL